MRALYFGTYRINYSRNTIMINGLRQNGVEVIECREQFWKNDDERAAAASGGWLDLGFIFRLILTYLRLALRSLRLPDFDVLVVAYPGLPDIPLAWVVSRLRGKPLVWDVYLSAYDLAHERGLDKRGILGWATYRLIYWAERLALRLPDWLIFDTASHRDYWERVYGLAEKPTSLVPIGYDDAIFRPGNSPVEKTAKDTIGRSVALYYGSFLPNHATEVIIKTADLLRQRDNVEFVLVGRGPRREAAQELAESLELPNVSFIDWLPQPELVERIRASTVCLGAFGDTANARMAIQNKTFESLALARPVVTRDSPGNSEIFSHRENIFLIPPESPVALAQAIEALLADPDLRRKIGENGQRLVSERYSVGPIGALFLRMLHNAVGSREKCREAKS